MLFNSVEFLIFFPVVTALYFILPHKYRWLLLLVANCIFYMALIPAYILILAATIVVDYIAGIYIEESRGRRKKVWLIVSIVSTCLILFVFKYFNFFNANFTAIASLLHWNYSVKALSIILPVGLSFHTFQSLSYVIEVYRGKQKAERNFGIYALYVMFYPQLVAGPIERPQNLLHQFYEKHNFDYYNVTEGLKKMAWGLFKKVIIADRLAIALNSVYSFPQGHEGLPLLLATVFFAIQIYADFSGYSDIALGAAQVMGFRLMKNFDSPYFSKSIAEFWTRWHISLSTWFRDYVYIPLGGNRVGKSRWQFNLMLTFLISGLWHGASWTYVIWGVLNGFYLVFSIWTKNIRGKIAAFIGIIKYPKLYNLWKVFVTFSLTCFAWILFRAESLSDAWYIATHLFTNWKAVFNFSQLKTLLPSYGVLGPLDTKIIFASIILLLAVDYWQLSPNFLENFSKKPYWVRWGVYYALVLAIIFYGVFSQSSFIYFQF